MFRGGLVLGFGVVADLFVLCGVALVIVFALGVLLIGVRLVVFGCLLLLGVCFTTSFVCSDWLFVFVG